MENNVVRKKGISGSTIKMIAMITMLIDHIGATVVADLIRSNYLNFGPTGEMRMNSIGITYYAMRSIGRIAFPIFIFLLIEGFCYTRNRFRYVGRMLLFAVISEIPFDMAFSLSLKSVRSGKIIEFEYQNVFFTLSIGLIVLLLVELVKELEIHIVLKNLLIAANIIIGAGIAEAMGTDYGAFGVLAITAAYFLRNNRKELRIAIPCLILTFSSMLELVALIDIIPIHFYNGERGWKLKWVFYLFYPVHLLILAMICYFAL